MSGARSSACAAIAGGGRSSARTARANRRCWPHCCPSLEAAGRKVLLIELHDGQRTLPAEVERLRFDAAMQLVIDGYEQLSRWQRLRIKRRCRLAGCGLLVTAHVSVGLPDLYRTQADLETAHRIVQALLGDDRTAIRPDEIERCFHEHRGNLREMLFCSLRSLRATSLAACGESGGVLQQFFLPALDS